MGLHRQTAFEAREKYGWEMPTLKLARIIYNENQLLYKDVDSARRALRTLEGKASKDSIVIKEIPNRPLNPYNLPASDETPFEPYFIKGVSKLLCLADIHVPYHSISALTAVLDYAKKQTIDGVLLNGDAIDCHLLSRFAKDPKKRDFGGELQVFKDLVHILQKRFPKAKMFFKLGNHEERYNHYLMMKAHELMGVKEFELSEIIKARAEGIEVISDKRIIKANDLNIIHGHEFASGLFSPVNIARGLYLRGKANAIQGHNHATSTHTESNLNGDVVTTWSSGCLSELHPAYMPINKWNHGFAIIELDSNKKSFQVHNKTIIKGKVF